MLRILYKRVGALRRAEEATQTPSMVCICSVRASFRTYVEHQGSDGHRNLTGGRFLMLSVIVQARWGPQEGIRSDTEGRAWHAYALSGRFFEHISSTRAPIVIKKL